MSSGLGTELPQRTAVVWLLVATAVLFAVPCAAMVRRALREREVRVVLVAWAVTAALVAVVVVTPLLVAVSIHRQHTWVSDEAVTRTRGDEVVERVRLADVEQVRVRTDGGLGALTPERLNLVVEVEGPGATGERRVLRVSRVVVSSLEPLLARLAEEVRRRPALLADDAERRLFEAALEQEGVTR